MHTLEFVLDIFLNPDTVNSDPCLPSAGLPHCGFGFCADIMSATGKNMESGTVKWFSPVKGYGFITKPDGADVFIHSTGLAPEQDRHLFPGDTVEFDEVEGERGPKAITVRRTGSNTNTEQSEEDKEEGKTEYAESRE